MNPRTCLRSLSCGYLLTLLAACGKPAPVAPNAPPAATTVDQGFRSQVPSPQPAVALQRPVASSAQLGNGFSLWFLPSEARTLSLRLTCRVGSRDNPTKQSGLAALTLRMLTEGTLQKSSLDLAVAAESLGSTLGHDSGRDASRLDLEVLPENEEQGIALLAEVARKPAFREADLERVKKEWLDDLITEREDPDKLAWMVGYRALLGPRLGISVRGTPGDIRGMTEKQLSAFFESSWTPERCALLAVGPSSLSSIEGIAAPLFGNWQPGKSSFREPPSTLAAPAHTTVYVFDRPGAVQSALFVAGIAPTKYAPGYEARQVLNNLFGGLFTSRLNQNLREKNAYTYGAFSTFVGTRDFGLWAASSSVRSDVTQAALDELLGEWQRLTTPGGIQADEISRARTDLAFRTSANLEHTSQLLSELEEIFVYELPSDYYSALPAQLAAVEQASLKEQLKHVPGRGSIIAVVGDGAKLGQLSQLGTVRPVGLQWLDGGD